jgi:hypothetical protein
MRLSELRNNLQAIIFLDLDGVANRWGDNSVPLVDPQCAEHLNAIFYAVPECRVVVSASARHLVHSGEMTLAGLEYLLRSHGLQCSVVGVTEADVEEGEGEQITRGEQIRNYLRQGDYGRHVVLDDTDAGISACGLNLVQTNGRRGLTVEDAERAIGYLMAQPALENGCSR